MEAAGWTLLRHQIAQHSSSRLVPHLVLPSPGPTTALHLPVGGDAWWLNWVCV